MTLHGYLGNYLSASENTSKHPFGTYEKYASIGLRAAFWLPGAYAPGIFEKI